MGVKITVESKLRRFVQFTRRARAGYLGEDAHRWKVLQKQGRVTVGKHTYGIPEVWTYHLGTEKLHVGAYSSLGSTFLLGGKHAVDAITTYPHRINWRMPGAGEDGFPTPTGDTHVGSDCWVCPGALVMSGVTIGDGAIVGGGSVVTKDVPPYAIVGGNPAKVIRYRFTEEQIAALLEIRWWDWPDEDVRDAVPLLAGKDIQEFLDYAYARMGKRPARVD